MKVKRIKHCFFCEEDIEALAEFQENHIVQKCPKCGNELGRAGAFFTEPGSEGTKARVKVIVK